MKLANLHLVTGYAGYEHVTAADQGAFNVAMLGSGQFVIDNGNKFAASVVTNNTVRVTDGDIYMQGRYIRLNEDTFVDLTIDNGAQGKKRNDLIVARYTKDAASGVEEVNLVVIKGTDAASTSTPVDPAYNSGNIIDGKDSLNDMPLYRVPIDGLNVQTLVPLFTVKTIAVPQTAADVGAVSKSGDTMTGALGVNSGCGSVDATNGRMRMVSYPNPSDTTQYASLAVYNQAGGATVKDFVRAFFPEDGTSTRYDIYHTGNKPTAEDVGAAPAGFGLGTSAALISNTDLLTTLATGKSGWYRGTNVANAPSNSWCYFHVIADSANYSVVLAYPMSGSEYRALYEKGTLTEWAKTSTTTHTHTAADVGALAENAPVCTDCDTEIKVGGQKITLKKLTADSANSPNKAGLISYTQGFILTYAFSTAHGNQYAFLGGMIFCRTYANSSMGAWKQAASTNTYTATVPNTWTASGEYFYQDIAVNGILDADNPVVDIVPGSDNAANILYAEAICKVFRITTSANSIRVWAKEAVTTAFPIQLKVVR